MENYNSIDKIIMDFNFIENMYESIRLVDPIEKKVFKVIKKSSKEMSTEDNCYNFWENNKICDNCVSCRAYIHNKTYTKIEYNQSSIYIMTAVPFNKDNIVLEFMQNASSDYFDNSKNFNDIIKLIRKQNLSIVKNTLTNLYNDQFIFDRLPHDIAFSHRESINIALFFIKIKDMDYINNTYEYSVGNQVIHEVSKVLKVIPRHEKDWISSYRGVRFVLVMYNINENQVGRTCNYIYDRINNLDFSYNNVPVKIEVGIGYHILKDKLITPEQFLENAKDMLKVEKKLEINDNRAQRLILKYSLTYREKEIVFLLLKGKSNAEIADALYIGLSTVKKHVSALFSKIEVKSRSELIAKINNEYAV